MVEAPERFTVVAQAARGGMGVVYKARDSESGAIVALKLVGRTDAASARRFEREAAILAELDHPGIVRYVAHGVTARGEPYLAMEWAEGETLHARLAGAGLALADAVELGRRVAEALGYAHARGIVHRDIKPTNLVLRDRELAKVAVLDFGIARAETSGGLTSTGALVGTPAYMSPEQARGEHEVGPCADVFALGCVLYECITGRRAFEGKHVLALLAKVVLWEPPAPSSLDPSVPVEVDRVLAQLLAKDPARRPRDGSEAAALLAALEVPASTPRRAHVAPAPTARVDRAAPRDSATLATNARIASIVVATSPASEIEPPDREWGAAGAAAIAAQNLPFERLHDGSLVAAITGRRDADVAARALVCARAVRAALPDALIMIATGEIGEGDVLVELVGTLLGDAVDALAREAMAHVFAGVAAPARPPGAIRVDERTARHLPAATVVRIKSACYVAPEAA